MSPTVSPTNKSDLKTTLFQASGSSSTYRNSWAGWYSAGYVVSSGSGKRDGYNTLALRGLRFEDASGKYIEYKLDSSYVGKSLLQIVQQCMGSARSNTGSSTWKYGHCTVGSVVSSTGISGAAKLRIGVGDGGSDGKDWALFMPLSGNGSGDFDGSNIWAFGSEAQTNTGTSSVVTIYGLAGNRLCYACTICFRFSLWCAHKFFMCCLFERQMPPLQW